MQFHPARHSWLVALALLLPPLGFSRADTPADLLTAEMLVDLKTVSSIDLSPSGKHVTYLLEVPRAAEDEHGSSYRELWVANLESNKTRRFTSQKERVSSPAFAPDGKSITFRVERSKVHEHTQIYSIRLRGGEARLLTQHPSSVEAYRWSPDGKSIAFTASRPETEAEKEAEKSGQDWRDFDQDHKLSKLWIFDVKSRKSRQLFSDALHVLDFAWKGNGDDLVFRASKTPTSDDTMMSSQLYLLPSAGGSPRQLLETPGKLAAFAISPDGDRLAFLGAVSQNDPIAQSLFILPFGDIPPMGDGVARNLTDGYEGSATQIAWRDDDSVLMASVEGQHSALYEVRIKDGQRKKLAWPNLAINDLDLQMANNRLAVAAHSASHPTELFVATADGGSLQRIENHNPALEDVRLAHQEEISWKGADGWDIGGVLTYPIDYEKGRRYPLVLQVHGGPEGVSLDGWTSTSTYPVQLLARDGFMVFQPNYRGSQGRGVAYSKADHDDLGGKEYEDVLAGIDALVERGLVDGERVGTGGWSYGGYFSAWAATRHSHRFRAAVVGAGLTNWIAFAGTTDIPREMSLVHWNSWWYDEPELHWQRSPLAHLDKAQTPTLFLHGEKDERVHPEQSQELYTALRLKGVPTRYVLYPREPHGLNERAHRLDAIQRVLDWFGEYLKLPEVQGIEKPRN